LNEGAGLALTFWLLHAFFAILAILDASAIPKVVKDLAITKVNTQIMSQKKTPRVVKDLVNSFPYFLIASWGSSSSSTSVVTSMRALRMP
jgi:hypothetical protein